MQQTKDDALSSDRGNLGNRDERADQVMLHYLVKKLAAKSRSGSLADLGNNLRMRCGAAACKPRPRSTALRGISREA